MAGNHGRRVIADDKAPKGPKDPSRVALGEKFEIAYWSQKFAVSPEKLAEAVKAAGNFSTAVEDYLKNCEASRAEDEMLIRASRRKPSDDR